MIAIDNCVWEVSDAIRVNGLEIWNKEQLLMKKILNELSSLDYHTGKKLEKAVEKVFKSNNLKYKPQPNGQQKYPDFHVWVGHKMFAVECKSSKSKKITWNQGWPKDNSLYVFSTSSKKCRGTYLFMGQDHWPSDVKDYYLKEVLVRVKADQATQNKIAREKFGDDLPFTYYCREMWNDRRSPIDNNEEKIKNVYDYFYKELK